MANVTFAVSDEGVQINVDDLETPSVKAAVEAAMEKAGLPVNTEGLAFVKNGETVAADEPVSQEDELTAAGNVSNG